MGADMPWRVGLGLVAVGLLGLAAGWILFPESNLLGGLALVFGPLYWIGCVILAVAGCRRGLLALARWRHRSGRHAPREEVK